MASQKINKKSKTNKKWQESYITRNKRRWHVFYSLKLTFTSKLTSQKENSNKKLVVRLKKLF